MDPYIISKNDKRQAHVSILSPLKKAHLKRKKKKVETSFLVQSSILNIPYKIDTYR